VLRSRFITLAQPMVLSRLPARITRQAR
jgi:hypothetical protein